MPQITWDADGERLYETGVDRGVLFVQNEAGAYGTGVAWNGLTAVTQSPSGAEPTPIYADNIQYLNLISNEIFAATIEAYTYPVEFYPCDGAASPAPGLTVGQQTRRGFAFSYRTLVGNDLVGTDFGYKIHIVYGAKASPSERAAATVNETPEAATLSWEVSTTPVPIPGFKPSAILTIDSTTTSAAAMKEIEDALYGTASTEPRLLMPQEAIDIINGVATTVTPVAPTFALYNLDATITIPVVTGVNYAVDGVPATGTVVITDVAVVTATAATGYTIASGATTTWTFDPEDLD